MTKKKNIHVIGIGTAGSYLVKLLHKKGVDAKFTYVSDQKISELDEKAQFIEYVPQTVMQEIDGKEYPVSDMSAMPELPQQLKDLPIHDDKYILLAGLGGHTGTYFTEQLAQEFERHQKPYAVVCSLPFSIEGRKKLAYATEAKRKLKQKGEFYCVELEKLRYQYGGMSIKEAFDIADEEIGSIFDKLYTSYAEEKLA
jgi:cell division protein FtsZ